MIRFSDLTFTYEGADHPTLQHVELTIDEGEFCLVVGETGSGKTTFLRTINGLVPHFTGGHVSGDVSVDGRSTGTIRPRELADLVGVVGQNPASSFVTDTVEDELAYTMENLGVRPDAMRRRVEDTLDLLGLHELRNRSLGTLSGGQQQRVAIGAVLTRLAAGAGPRRADFRPRSGGRRGGAGLPDPAGARPGDDRGARRAPPRTGASRSPTGSCSSRRRAAVVVGATADVMADSPVAPPVVELGRLAGWDPLRCRCATPAASPGPLRARLAGRAAGRRRPARPPGDPASGRRALGRLRHGASALGGVTSNVARG